MERNRPIPDTEYEIALLQYILVKGEIRPFLKATGNDVARLSRTIDEFLAKGYLERDGNSLSLSNRGMAYHKALNKKLGRRGMYAFILPEYSAKIPQMEKTEIYIPKYMFKRGGGHFSNSYVLGRSGESSGDKESTFKHDK